MKIIKHGTPKDCLHFICGKCGCEWLATKEEADKTPDVFLVEENDGYVMTCPDCYNAFGHTIKSHGRLIDANILIKYINDALGDPDVKHLFRRFVEVQPTAIESEG